MSKYLDLAKKLQALADRGIGGEKINAEKKLRELMAKHNISEFDLSDDKIEEFFFKIEDKEEKTILYQLTKLINKDIKVYFWDKKEIRKYKFKGNVEIDTTKLNYIRIAYEFPIYVREYKKAKELLMYAFLRKNNLLLPRSEENEPTEEEIKFAEKAAAMSWYIDRAEIDLAIEQ